MKIKKKYIGLHDNLRKKNFFYRHVPKIIITAIKKKFFYWYNVLKQLALHSLKRCRKNNKTYTLFFLSIWHS